MGALGGQKGGGQQSRTSTDIQGLYRHLVEDIGLMGQPAVIVDLFIDLSHQPVFFTLLVLEAKLLRSQTAERQKQDNGND